MRSRYITQKCIGARPRQLKSLVVLAFVGKAQVWIGKPQGETKKRAYGMIIWQGK